MRNMMICELIHQAGQFRVGNEVIIVRRPRVPPIQRIVRIGGCGITGNLNLHGIKVKVSRCDLVLRMIGIIEFHDPVDQAVIGIHHMDLSSGKRRRRFHSINHRIFRNTFIAMELVYTIRISCPVGMLICSIFRRFRHVPQANIFPVLYKNHIVERPHIKLASSLNQEGYDMSIIVTRLNFADI